LVDHWLKGILKPFSVALSQVHLWEVILPTRSFRSVPFTKIERERRGSLAGYRRSSLSSHVNVQETKA